MNGQDQIQREILPIPDFLHVRLTTYDAKDPDTNKRTPKSQRSSTSSRCTTSTMARWNSSIVTASKSTRHSSSNWSNS